MPSARARAASSGVGTTDLRAPVQRATPRQPPIEARFHSVGRAVSAGGGGATTTSGCSHIPAGGGAGAGRGVGPASAIARWAESDRLSTRTRVPRFALFTSKPPANLTRGLWERGIGGSVKRIRPFSRHFGGV